MSSTLILLRHGQSTWNLANRFTGWHDVPLTDAGRVEATRAGELLLGAGIEVERTHTSLLKRAIQTHHLALEAMDRLWLPVTRHWRLNERHYGALQGLDKKETSERYGEEQVFAWRRSWDVPPPPVDPQSEHHPANDSRYASIPQDVLPAGECLADVVDRVLPYWHDRIAPDLLAGRCVLVVAHGNSLRALVKHLDGIPDDEINALNIPTGVPLRYTLDRALQPVDRAYLGDPEEARRKAEAVARQATSGVDPA